MAIKKKAKIEEESSFTKSQLLRSRRYYGKRDLLNALLDDDTMYTVEQVDEIVNAFLKGKV